MYMACAYAYLCVYIHGSHHAHAHFKHVRLSFCNVLKAMNVCVQNTVFLRRIGYSFCFSSELGGHISKNVDGKKPGNSSDYSSRPSFIVQGPSSVLFLAPPNPPHLYPCRENRKLMFFKVLGWFFLCVLWHIYYLLESILNQKAFSERKKKSSLGQNKSWVLFFFLMIKA